jgi:hypothetical protein
LTFRSSARAILTRSGILGRWMPRSTRPIHPGLTPILWARVTWVMRRRRRAWRISSPNRSASYEPAFCRFRFHISLFYRIKPRQNKQQTNTSMYSGGHIGVYFSSPGHHFISYDPICLCISFPEPAGSGADDESYYLFLQSPISLRHSFCNTGVSQYLNIEVSRYYNPYFPQIVIQMRKYLNILTTSQYRDTLVLQNCV